MNWALKDTELTSEKVLESMVKFDSLKKKSRTYLLLEYLLKSEASALTEYDIAYDVLGRGEDFDPTIDSIVRSEMHRLRKKLEVFNLKNSQRAGFEITIPPKTYRPIINPITKVTGSNDTEPVRKVKRLGIFKLILPALIAPILFTGYKVIVNAPDERNPVVPENRIVPKISVVHDSDDVNDPSRVLRKLNDRLELFFGTYFGVQLTEMDDAEYVLTLKDFTRGSPEDPGSDSFIAQLSDRNGNAIKGARYSIQNKDGVHNFREAFRRIWVDYTYIGGAVLFDLETNLSWSKKRREQYKCLMDIVHLNASNQVSFFEKPKDLLECSDVGKVFHPKDKGLMHAARSMLYYSDYMNYTSLDVDENTFLLAESELAEARRYDRNNSLFLTMTLAIEKARPGPRNLKNIRRKLVAAERSHSHDLYLMMLVADIYGYYLGDWSEHHRIVDVLFRGDETQSELYRREFLAAALSGRDVEVAMTHAKKYEIVPKDNFDLAMLATAACMHGDKDLSDFIKSDMKDRALTSVKTYRDLVTGKNYEENLTQAMLSITQDPVCDIFD